MHGPAKQRQVMACAAPAFRHAASSSAYSGTGMVNWMPGLPAASCTLEARVRGGMVGESARRVANEQGDEFSRATAAGSALAFRILRHSLDGL